MKKEKYNRKADGTTKSERNARVILRRIHLHNPDAGGIFGLITGSQGSGKTSILLSFCAYALKNYPKEKIFFSSCYDAPLQFLKLPLKDIHIMVKRDTGFKIRFLDRDNKLKDITDTLKISYFKDNDELYRRAKPGKVNCVFFGNRAKWMEFIKYLRSVGEFSHVFIDELSEISPAFQSGKLWKQIFNFATDCKEIRKSMINVFCNTQSTIDIDFRVLSKLMVQIFLPGSFATKHSRIIQGAIDNLREDPINGSDAYLESSGKFGKVHFKDIYKPIPGLSWQATKVKITKVV